MKLGSYITDCSSCIDQGFLRNDVSFCLMAVDLDALDSDSTFDAKVVLAIEEQEQVKTYTFAKRRREWLGGRIACKEAVAELLGLHDLKTITVLNDEHGRPFIRGDGCQDVHVSITHSGRFAMALACNVPCGLDLQEMTSSLERVREKYILPGDQASLDQLSGPTSAKLGLVWAIKEAVRKQVDLWPLLGFLETRLAQVRICGEGYAVHCSPVVHERALPEDLPGVFATIYKQYALAVSFGSKK